MHHTILENDIPMNDIRHVLSLVIHDAPCAVRPSAGANPDFLASQARVVILGLAGEHHTPINEVVDENVLHGASVEHLARQEPI